MRNAVFLFVMFGLGLLGSRAQQCSEFTAPGGGRVWVYMPEGSQAPGTIPLVVVPPAGSRLFHGMLLSDGDRDEHWPYVRRGFAVVSFDISGELPDLKDAEKNRQAIKRFLAADCGVLDAKHALKVAWDHFPEIDQTRTYVAGHSSAATLALQIAASDLDVKACIAMAPIGNMAQRFKEPGLRWLNREVSGSAAILVARSPDQLGAKIHCPVFLFHAHDDDNVLPTTVIHLRDALVASGVKVTYKSVAEGGHYNSMISDGLPAAVEWLFALDHPRSNPSSG